MDPAFLAGAVLAAIDPIARSFHPLSTLWRRRLALKAAENLARLQGRVETAAEIRDHFFLTRDGGDPGPAGNLLVAMRALSDVRALTVEQWSSFLPEPLQVLCDLAAVLEAMPNSSPIATAAAVAKTCLDHFPHQTTPALFLADLALARELGWRAPVPLLSGHLTRSDLKQLRSHTGQGTQALPSAWLDTSIRLYARSAIGAADLYSVLARRAEKLIAVAPKLRAKDAEDVVLNLLSEDAQLAGPGKLASDRSSRRLFERLVQLGGARELTGRATSRLYGL